MLPVSTIFPSENLPRSNVHKLYFTRDSPGLCQVWETFGVFCWGFFVLIAKSDSQTIFNSQSIPGQKWPYLDWRVEVGEPTLLNLAKGLQTYHGRHVVKPSLFYRLFYNHVRPFIKWKSCLMIVLLNYLLLLRVNELLNANYSNDWCKKSSENMGNCS